MDFLIQQTLVTTKGKLFIVKSRSQGKSCDMSAHLNSSSVYSEIPLKFVHLILRIWRIAQDI